MLLKINKYASSIQPIIYPIFNITTIHLSECISKWKAALKLTTFKIVYHRVDSFFWSELHILLSLLFSLCFCLFISYHICQNIVKHFKWTRSMLKKKNHLYTPSVASSSKSFETRKVRWNLSFFRKLYNALQKEASEAKTFAPWTLLWYEYIFRIIRIST